MGAWNVNTPEVRKGGGWRGVNCEGRKDLLGVSFGETFRGYVNWEIDQQTQLHPCESATAATCSFLELRAGLRIGRLSVWVFITKCYCL